MHFMSLCCSAQTALCLKEAFSTHTRVCCTLPTVMWRVAGLISIRCFHAEISFDYSLTAVTHVVHMSARMAADLEGLQGLTLSERARACP